MEIIRQTLDLEAEIGPGAWDLSIPEVRARTARRQARQGEEQARLAAAIAAAMGTDPDAYRKWVLDRIG
ncbi:hypothetical protein ASF49_08080 [Methylobacterium sp. Leaf104]|uniref:hypothetical protein n=1 Tax=Methylobacterium TaxID=407 RepID=UPI0006F74B63|nr:MULTISPECIES: hypothetical protein [Methylobacterium]KQO49750.1 hypothetical protein ASF08_22920 [Methylobacterium sp. Leaf85]KQP33815.1 hypothetical protein ASF49_08080 [Methylobacterium sp. Leaf104]MCI9879617.1 hypothetical protein [Methylobacterium goesingense]